MQVLSELQVNASPSQRGSATCSRTVLEGFSRSCLSTFTRGGCKPGEGKTDCIPLSAA